MVNVTQESAVGASYIVSFYDVLNKLTGDVSSYRTFIRKVSFLSNGNAEALSKNLTDEDKMAQNVLAENIHFYADHVLAKGKVIASRSKTLDTKWKVVEELIAKVHSEHLPDGQTCTNLVLAVHDFFGESVLQNLLKTSQEIITKVAAGGVN